MGWQSQTGSAIAPRDFLRHLPVLAKTVTEIKDKAYNARAVLQDGSLKPSETAVPLMSDDEIQLSDVTADTELTTEMDTEDGEEVQWILPKLDPDAILDEGKEG